MSTPASKFFLAAAAWLGLQTFLKTPSNQPFFLRQNRRAGRSAALYYYKIHEYWLIYKVFPAARTLLPGSELLVRIKNGCFLPFITGDSRLGRPETYYYYLAFEEWLPIKVFCRSSSVHGCGSKTPEP